MNMPFVSLRPEITRAHALTLMDWFEDERVTRFLTDSQSTSRFIAQAVERTHMPILTHLFNQGSRFFMVYDRNDTPVGFVRLLMAGTECEIVLTIGDHEKWGRRLGTSTILEGLKIAFLEMKAERVIAKIHPENTRSLRGFMRCGFVAKRATPTLKSFTMSSGRYLQLLQDGGMAVTTGIYITEIDKARLHRLIESEDDPVIVDLEHEIERATVVLPQEVIGSVVTMNSEVLLKLDDEPRQVALVYPHDADEESGKLSVLSDLGTAVLGHQEGDIIDWLVADRTRRIQIEKVIYQPESCGDLHL
ncbi:bifunctional GNAT family N-acetyltransferase/nucleoside diphosphate kinase regulator [Paracoccus cavernae]|uniref:bifunctional GNAT family N-acetyltransferase/nucleoside diphosphate kinase regulator n=1 Tax=Paracoccus cavernae TaxID=1571207 RepID=UPI0035F2E061